MYSSSSSGSRTAIWVLIPERYRTGMQGGVMAHGIWPYGRTAPALNPRPRLLRGGLEAGDELRGGAARDRQVGLVARLRGDVHVHVTAVLPHVEVAGEGVRGGADADHRLGLLVALVEVRPGLQGHGHRELALRELPLA